MKPRPTQFGARFPLRAEWDAGWEKSLRKLGMLNEIASSSGVGMELDETAIPVHQKVCGACEMLGLDPLDVNNQGKLAAIIGRVTADQPRMVVMRTSFGTRV